MEQYAKIQQILKKEEGQKERKPIYPPTVIQAVFDAKTGASLEAILAQFNSIYVQYQGTPQDTRCIIPKEMRRAGLTITYMNMDSETITERAASAVQKDNDHWGLDINWSRVDELSLSGDISVSAQGTWIINGEDTGIKALGPKGDAGLTPWLKTIDNRLHLSYDNVNWEPCSEPIAAYFRFNATSGNTQSGTIGKIQISRDNKTWNDLSPEFTNNLHISGYVATTSALPANKPVGTIYGVGPTYATEDTAQTNPIYRLYVYNGTTWVDNGQFTSIAAGIVQETGNSETEVMSQKAVSEKLTELATLLSINKYLNGYINVSGEFKSHANYRSTDFIIVSEGDTFVVDSLANKNMCKFAYYDDEKSFIPDASMIGEDISFSLIKVTVPSGVSYVRFSSEHNESNTLNVMYTFTNLINYVDKKCEVLNDSIQSILGVKYLNGYINVSGEFKSHANYRSTDFIIVSEGDTFVVDSLANKNMCKFAYYDDEKSFIPDASMIGEDISFSLIKVTVPSGVSYVRFSSEHNESNTLNVMFLNYDIITKTTTKEDKIIGATVKNDNYDNLNLFVKELSVYNYDLIGHELTLYGIGILSTSSFYVWIYDNTLKETAFYGITDYDSIPTTGVEQVTFNRYVGKYNKGGIECVVNWGNFNNVTLPDRDTESGIYISNNVNSVNIGNNTPLESVINRVTIIKGNYTLNSEITLSKGKSLIGDNCVVKCTKEASIIMSEGCSLQNINFVGDWDIVRESYQSGYAPLISEELLIEGADNTLWGEGYTADNALIKTQESTAKNTSVLNCTFDNFDRCVIYLNGGAHQDSQNPQVRGCYFNKCWCGIYGKGEFTRISDNCFFQCVICVNLYGGNISKVGNVMKGCDVGYYYSDGRNNGHGEMVGCEMAHCNVAGIYIKKLQSNCGDIISGCQVVDAPIIAEECHSLLISGCRFDTWIRIAVGGKNAIINNLVGIAYKKGNPLYNVPNDTKITINTPINNATDEEINLQ